MVFHCSFGTYEDQVLAHVVPDETHKRAACRDVIRAALERHRQQTQAHVNHDVTVVSIQRVGERHEEAEEFADARQTVGNQRTT